MNIAITGIGSISPLGTNKSDIWSSYKSQNSLIKNKLIDGKSELVAPLTKLGETMLDLLKQERRTYTSLDRSVLLSIIAARNCYLDAKWNEHVGVNISSSRGATETFEKNHEDFLKFGKVSSHCSPTTTLGNISSWVAQDLKLKAISIENSMTCSSAFHALLNGISWIESGLVNHFIFGGSEAPLTPFTLAQMKALKIYRNDFDQHYPCKPFGSDNSGMVLGEGSCVMSLEKMKSNMKVHGIIESIGFGIENISSPTSISSDGVGLENSMKSAIEKMSTPKLPEVVITHAPGTRKGDSAELNAIKKVFPDLPILTSNKWLIGHTLGASAAFSLEYALYILKNNEYIDFPYKTIFEKPKKNIEKINKVLINATGFGGNCVSVVVTRPNL
ncbi:MAG: beta-ketoacyl synthase [Epsilonproteobacteria bacterium]|nr:MAG: beta-ketoacyl synthase [Campylobacterota bacterium]RLA67685.1 MAG: beta-ketoacyl synthase [Campylobacterota bacterium]